MFVADKDTNIKNNLYFTKEISKKSYQQWKQKKNPIRSKG